MLPSDISTQHSERAQDQIIQTSSLAFLHERASDRTRLLSAEEQHLLHQARQALLQAERVIICVGGRAGRLGEALVGTSLLEGVLLALRTVGNVGLPIHLIVDESAAELFDERVYQALFWPQFRVLAAPQGQTLAMVEGLLQRSAGKHCLVVDLHGAQDGMPFLRSEEWTVASASDCSKRASWSVTTLGRLFRVGVRSYAQHGPQNRYADFVEDLFAFPAGTLDRSLAQPCIRLSATEEANYPESAQAFGLRRSALLVVCFFQSLVPAKCYGHWREVLTLLCQQLAGRFPQQSLDVLVACGPDEELPNGVKLADVAEEFTDFTGYQGNARLVVRATPSLRDLAMLVKHAALVLANDTGPGHLAGALGIPTVVPYLPGQVYSRTVWASTPWHHGVTLEPNPFRSQDIEAAVLWDNTDIIDSIPPERLSAEALACLEARLLNDDYTTQSASATPADQKRSTSAARYQPHPLEG